MAKEQVDITKVDREALENVVMQLQTDNKLMAQQIIAANRLNRDLEAQLEEVGSRLLAVRSLVGKIDIIVGLKDLPTGETDA